MPALTGHTTDIAAPEPLFRRISYASGVFFALAMHLRALANLPLRRLDPPLGPTAQRLPSQKTRLLDHPLFRRVGFLQCPLVAFDRQHNRRYPLAKLRMRPQRRHQRLIAQLPDRHPSPPAKSIKPNLPCIGLNRTHRYSDADRIQPESMCERE